MKLPEGWPTEEMIDAAIRGYDSMDETSPRRMDFRAAIRAALAAAPTQLAQGDELRKAIGEHLAFVHRDGGHHHEKVGDIQAIEDATRMVIADRLQLIKMEFLRKTEEAARNDERHGIARFLEAAGQHDIARQVSAGMTCLADHKLRQAAEKAAGLLNDLLDDGLINGHIPGVAAAAVRNSLRAALEGK